MPDLLLVVSQSDSRPQAFPQHCGTFHGSPLDPPPGFWCGSESGSCLNCQLALSCQGEVLRLQAKMGIGWCPPQSLLEPSHSQVCLGLFFFLTQESFQHLGVLPILRLMDEEGASHLPPPGHQPRGSPASGLCEPIFGWTNRCTPRLS